MAGPLEGVRVLDLTSVVLGPWACQMLGDLGADVIEVEPPGGDSNRQVGPSRHPLMGALFVTCNRNKRSLVLDLKQDRGRQALLKLASHADVLVHNFRPAALARLALEYDTVRRSNPRIILCGTYGFGRRGPYADRPAYDDLIQAASGVAGLAETVTGVPAFLPTLVADKTTAMAVVSAVTSALFFRERSGLGQEIEVPMFETLVSYVMVEHLYGRAFEPATAPAGYPRILSAFRRPHRTRDGYLAVLPYLNEHWRAFCDAAGRPGLAEEARFGSLASRLAHVDDVYAETARIIATKTTAEWLDVLGRANVPVMVVNSLESLLSDPHLEAVGFWQTADHPTEGTLRFPACPVTFSASPGDVRRLPPRLGEHSVEILREIGCDEETIREMIASGVTKTA